MRMALCYLSQRVAHRALQTGFTPSLNPAAVNQTPAVGRLSAHHPPTTASSSVYLQLSKQEQKWMERRVALTDRQRHSDVATENKRDRKHKKTTGSIPVNKIFSRTSSRESPCQLSLSYPKREPSSTAPHSHSNPPKRPPTHTDAPLL